MRLRKMLRVFIPVNGESAMQTLKDFNVELNYIYENLNHLLTRLNKLEDRLDNKEGTNAKEKR